ncbi:MAG: formylglycine-generating enzyme family protein [Deltaproteobacteria bacterium]|nr:formylglycine-generating enzyme family protein [Deltaproteobacteria bacterium]
MTAQRKKIEVTDETGDFEATKSKGRVRLLVEALVVCAIIALVYFSDRDASGPPRQSGSPSSGAPVSTTPLPLAGPHEPVIGTGGEDAVVPIPAGTFRMGCSEGDAQCDAHERPAHDVTLSAFEMDLHEVTVAAYRECVRAGVCAIPSINAEKEAERYYNWGKDDRDAHPVNGVSWYEAEAYCRWKGKRLPTEAEFEYALRAGRATKWPWGEADAPPAGFGNYADAAAKEVFTAWEIYEGYTDGHVGTAPVCSFPKNAFGLCDVSGNIYEWTADWYDADAYSKSTAEDPRGAISGGERVIRGGSWDAYRTGQRSSYRFRTTPVARSNSYGFRCARSAS